MTCLLGIDGEVPLPNPGQTWLGRDPSGEPVTKSLGAAHLVAGFTAQQPTEPPHLGPRLIAELGAAGSPRPWVVVVLGRGSESHSLHEFDSLSHKDLLLPADYPLNCPSKPRRARLAPLDFRVPTVPGTQRDGDRDN